MPTENEEFQDFELDYDYDGTKEFGGGSYPLLPAAEGYIFDVEFIKQGTNKNNKPYIGVRFVVAEEQDVPELAALAGQKAFGNYYTSKEALGRLKQFQIACGAPGPFQASKCMGARIRADITHSQGNAEPGPDGQPREAKTFANICNERPLDGGDAGQTETPPPPPPPVTKAAGTKPAAAGTQPPPNKGATGGAKNGTTARRA